MKKSTPLFFVIVALMLSCSSGPRKLVLPELPVVSTQPEAENAKSPFDLTRKTYVAYIYKKWQKDNLYRIELAVADCIKKNMDYLIYVEADSETEVKQWLTELDYKYSVVLDKESLFREANGESIEGYNGYIINKDREILGSPTIQYRK
ncbi:hypothetical protein EV198_2675 [Roseivirga ehrenbergii]|uniref:Uncharacterized protein n=1 Tax=Roseivirga ehrenbergii (strain DSM 102268 / JCM 13514 / KCTC 12282 / NCIMB 14502 / KMM 6017) TaxID=279360 RepID=A0A150XTL6_ROSEK|nr:hypothetical protein [Roseivirga ehrenbergii]KYG82063.1 hypothetical protein MB14_01320 [Roseivirga ehrenbergii]TCL01885.1 hypothetical protein EV198_2675 [Roseivirga ehrenbergii]